MMLGFINDTFFLFWGLFWHVWYLVPYAFSLSFVMRMYLYSTTTHSDDYNYTIEYRNGTKIVLQSFVETVGFFTGIVNSLLGVVNMLKVLVMTRLGVSRKPIKGGGGLNPAAFAAMMMQNISRREEVAEPKVPRSPSLRKAIRHPQSSKEE